MALVMCEVSELCRKLLETGAERFLQVCSTSDMLAPSKGPDIFYVVYEGQKTLRQQMSKGPVVCYMNNTETTLRQQTSKGPDDCYVNNTETSGQQTLRQQTSKGPDVCYVYF